MGEVDDPRRVAAVRGVMRPYIDESMSDDEVIGLARAIDEAASLPAAPGPDAALEAATLTGREIAKVADELLFDAELHLALYGAP